MSLPLTPPQVHSFRAIQKLPYFDEQICWVPYFILPRHTDTKIDELCARAKVAKTDREVKRVLSQLRAALTEHIGLARQSLEAQISTLSTLQAKTKDMEAKVRKPRLRKPRVVELPKDPQDGGASQTPNAA